MKVVFSRKTQNRAGSKLLFPDLYHQKLMLKTGSYVKACDIMYRKFNIRFNIEI